MNKKISEIINFLIDNKDGLIDHVVEDLKLKNLDIELSIIQDRVTGQTYNVSLEDIVNATKNRIITAIETWEERYE